MKTQKKTLLCLISLAAFIVVIGILGACGIDDITLKDRVKARLVADMPALADGIGVAVTGGVVTLSGAVDSEETKGQAEQFVKGVEGVKSVMNNLTVATPEPVVQEVVPPINSKFSLTSIDGKIQFSGLVPDESTKQAIMDQLKAVFGEENISGDISVDPNAKVPAWLPNLPGALPEFKMPGLELNFDGDMLNVGGSPSDAAKNDLIARVKPVFGEGLSIAMLPTSEAEAAPEEQEEKAAGGLASLQPGFTAEDLVNALNGETIHFASGSSKITSDSTEVLERSAEAIKAAPEGTMIEVGGHTDNTGNPAANQKLSIKRAEAVRKCLIRLGVDPASLSAKGYGDSKPISSNDTEEGRFENRRIEYTVVQ